MLQHPLLRRLVVVATGVYRRRTRFTKERTDRLAQLVAQHARELQAAKETADQALQEKNEVIRALKKSQEEMSRERERFKFIFESVPVGISWMVRGDPVSRIVNPAQARITGVPRERRHELERYGQATHPEDRERQTRLHARLLAGEIDHYTLEKRYLHPDGATQWAALTIRVYRDANGDVQEISTMVDINERKQAEARLAETHRQLMETSRQVGMAEVATGVLHNVGNVLNSVNVSATLLTNLIRQSKIEKLGKLSTLLRENEASLATFIAHDPRGQKLPDFVEALSAHLGQERADLLKELESLRKNIEHIKDIVAMQQTYAKVSGIAETIGIGELIEDALQMNAAGLTRHDVAVERDFQATPLVTVEKHKVLQILVNLFRNAKYACDESLEREKKMVVRVTADRSRVQISVIDNGVGIPAENLTRIFVHGFTTRKHGHGFGLHSCALAAKELGGSLRAHSAGPNQGATFILELPHQSEARAA